MKLKQFLIPAYLGIGLLFALYQWMFGITSYKGFWYAFGQGLVWPVVMFPAFGQIVLGIILVVVIAIMTMS